MTHATTSPTAWNQHLEESMGIRRDGESFNLLPGHADQQSQVAGALNATTIPLTLVIPDPQQPRTLFDDDSLQRLAQSIRTKGQLSPIRVRWSEELQHWVIVSGERRWRACQIAGLTTIHCCIQTEEVSPSLLLEEQLVENLLREDLNPIEEARAFQTLIEINHWSNKQLAEALAIPASKVTRTLALLKLPADIQGQIAVGDIPARTAYELSRVKNSAQQARWAERLLKDSQVATEIVQQVRRKPRRAHGASQPSLTFFPEGGWRITIIADRRRDYLEVEAALVDVLEEVRHRIRNQVRW